MRKGVFLFVLVLFVFSFASQIILAGEEDDLAYQWFEDQIESKRCTQLSAEELIFSVLVSGKCIAELQSSALNGECWPRSGCTLEMTAKAALALDEVREDTTKARDWMLAQKGISKDLDWFLEIDSDDEVTCKIRYISTNQVYEISIDEEKHIDSDAGSCLTLVNDNYWFQISKNCYEESFEISCNKDFISTLLFKRDGSPTLNVLGDTHSAGEGGGTIEEIKSACLKRGNSCDYLGSLWAVSVLDHLDEDVSMYIPYLNSLYSQELANFPEPFLYLLTEDAMYESKILGFQRGEKYWRVGNLGQYYSTALAMFPFIYRSMDEKENARNWLLDVQQDSGAWDNGNFVNTGFILYTYWPRAIDIPIKCGSRGEGYTCISDSAICAGNEVEDYCSSTTKCCYIEPPKQCNEQGSDYECVANAGECTGKIPEGYECDGDEVCCYTGPSYDCVDQGDFYSCVASEAACSGGDIRDWWDCETGICCYEEPPVWCGEQGDGYSCVANDAACSVGGGYIYNDYDCAVNGEVCCYIEPPLLCKDQGAGFSCVANQGVCDEDGGSYYSYYECPNSGACCYKEPLLLCEDQGEWFSCVDSVSDCEDDGGDYYGYYGCPNSGACCYNKPPLLCEEQGDGFSCVANEAACNGDYYDYYSCPNSGACCYNGPALSCTSQGEDFSCVDSVSDCEDDGGDYYNYLACPDSGYCCYNPPSILCENQGKGFFCVENELACDGDYYSYYDCPNSGACCYKEPPPLCEAQGESYFCLENPSDCLGDIEDGYSCDGQKICCHEELIVEKDKCIDKGYDCIGPEENCVGSIRDDLECYFGEICCTQTEPDELDFCEDYGFECLLTGTSCSGVSKYAYDCADGEYCCDPYAPYDPDDPDPDPNAYSCEQEGYYCMNGYECEGNELSFDCAGMAVCCDEPIHQETCEELGGVVCTASQSCSYGYPDSYTGGLGDGEFCCRGGGECVDIISTTGDCEANYGVCESECSSGYVESYDYSCDSFGDKCCVLMGSSEDPYDCETNYGICESECSEGYTQEYSYSCSDTSKKCCVSDGAGEKKSYWWIWVLLFLIIVVGAGILYKDKLREFYEKMMAKYSKGGKTKPSGPPGFPSRFPRPGMGGLRKPVHGRMPPRPGGTLRKPGTPTRPHAPTKPGLKMPMRPSGTPSKPSTARKPEAHTKAPQKVETKTIRQPTPKPQTLITPRPVTKPQIASPRKVLEKEKSKTEKPLAKKKPSKELDSVLSKLKQMGK